MVKKAKAGTPRDRLLEALKEQEASGENARLAEEVFARCDARMRDLVLDSQLMLVRFTI